MGARERVGRRESEASCKQLLLLISAHHLLIPWAHPPPSPCLVVGLATVSGGVDSGKSSLVAVLTHGSDGRPVLDNGRGSARMSVLRHKHELESGRTSSISQQALGYDGQGEVLNYKGVSGERIGYGRGRESGSLDLVDVTYILVGHILLFGHRSPGQVDGNVSRGISYNRLVSIPVRPPQQRPCLET